MPQVAILLVGVGGTGKSTAARNIQGKLRALGYNALLIHFDEMRKRFAPPGADPFSADAEVKRIIYERAAEVFRGYLSEGLSLVVDAGLSSERIRVQLKKEIRGLRIVHLHCPLLVAILRDTKRSLLRTPHERGWYLHLRALWDRLNPWLSPANRFPQPGITCRFEYPASADLHISTLFRSPMAVAEEVIQGLGISGQAPAYASLKERLKCSQLLLDLIDRKRTETGLPVGRNVERMLIDRELDELSWGPLQ